MAARLVLFSKPVLLTDENAKDILTTLENHKIPEGFEYKIETYSEPGTYELPIPTSSNYTLSIEADGSGMLQRTMASPGAKYRAVLPGKELPTFRAEKDQQKVETYTFLEETKVTMPLVFGSPEGLQLHGVFFNGG